MGDKYIQNKHNAPISANARDDKGAILYTKKFMPLITEKWSGKVISTGYEKLTEEEYAQLEKSSKTFRTYKDKLKLLVVHDDMPADLKTPHEALVDARKEAKEAAGKIKALKIEVEELKTKLLDAESKYKELSSATTDDEKLKPFKEQITSLEKDKEAMLASIKALETEREELKKANAEFKPVDGEGDKILALNKELVGKIVELRNKDKDIQKLVSEYAAKEAELVKVPE